MGIIKEIVELQTGIKNNINMANHYKDNLISYDVEKYQDEFFKYMEKVYPFRNGKNEILLENGIQMSIQDIKTVPNYPCQSNWTLCNMKMMFFSEKDELLRVTVDPYSDLIKVGKSGHISEVTGIDCINVTRYTSDKDKFLLAVESFKYVMNHPDEILDKLSENARAEYRYIVNSSYYDNLDKIQSILDLAKMVRMYMDNPATFNPFDSKKVDRPDFDKMTLEELIEEFNRKSNSDDIDKAVDTLSDVIFEFFPELENKAEEITEFYKLVSDNEEYISEVRDIDLNNEATIDNNGFSYYFKTYSSSSQMLIEILKDGERIGSLYYWKNRHRRDREALYLHISHLGCNRIDFRGLTKENIPVFIKALQNLEINWNQIVTVALNTFLKELKATLSDFKKRNDEALKEKDEAMKNFYERQESFADYF